MVRSVVFTTTMVAIKVNGSTPNLVSLLRPWIRCFTMIISAWFNSQPSLAVAFLDKMLHDDYLCLVESGKQQIKEVRKFNRKTWKQRQLLCESGFVVRIAPPPLSRDRRIKMKKSINQPVKFKVVSDSVNQPKYWFKSDCSITVPCTNYCASR